MTRLWLALALCLVLPFTGCSDAYGTAAKLAQDVAVSINQANLTVDQLRTAGTITPAEESTVLGYLNSLNLLDGIYIGCVQKVHAAPTPLAGGFTNCAQSLSSGIGNPATLAALHISNPTSQAKVTAVVQAVATLVTLTITSLGGN